MRNIVVCGDSFSIGIGCHDLKNEPYGSLLAKKLDMPIVFFAVERKKRGYYEATFQTLAENPTDYKDYEITDKFLKLVEKQIHEAPEYYLWTHKRWKHRES
mgnify:CR=1 FL=1